MSDDKRGPDGAGFVWAFILGCLLWSAIIGAWYIWW